MQFRKKNGNTISDEELRRQLSDEVRDILGDPKTDRTDPAGPSVYPGLEDRGIGSREQEHLREERLREERLREEHLREERLREERLREEPLPPRPASPSERESRESVRPVRNEVNSVRRKLRRSKGPYLFISAVTVLLFITLIAHLIYFNVRLKDGIINSPYNRRQNTLAEFVVRGPIRSSDGATLAYTETGEDGSETRVYPYGRIFAHVVGFMTHGKSGLESFANYQLLTSHSNIIDQVINDFKRRKNEGDAFVTTINAELQQACYEILGDYRGAIIAMEPDTGAIRAMVSKPDFDPNTLAADWDEMVGDSSNSQLVNRASQGLYAPGSTFKILTTLAWYQRDRKLEKFHFDCTGELTVGEITVHCYEGAAHGEEDLAEAFKHSCNTAFSQIGLDLGADALTSVARRMMFGESLPFDLAASRSRWSLSSASSDEELVQTAFGQGKTLVTPYHMALICSAIANKGVLMKPHLTDHIENAAGKRISSYRPSAMRTLLSTDEAETLSSLMRQVVTEGTAAALADRSCNISGKTGSAEFYRSDGSIGTHSWFTGFSDTEDSDLVVVVLAEDGGAGSTTAVPMAGRVFDTWYSISS